MASTSTSPATDASPAHPARSRWRPLAVIALVFPMMLVVVDVVVSYAAVVALVSGSIAVVLGVVAVGFVVLIASVVTVSRALTGTRTLLGALTVAVLLAWAGGFGFLTGILRPLALGEDVLRHVAVCGMAAVTMGLFLGPWPLRILGAVSAVGLIALLVLIPTPTEIATAEREKAAGGARDAARSRWLESGRFPLVTDLPGWSNVEVRATGSDAETWVRSETGSVARIITQWDSVPPDPLAPCSFIGGPGLEWDRGYDQLPTWCLHSGSRWERSDGTAIFVFDAGTTTWISSGGGYEAERVGGTQAAGAQEVAAVFGSLRPMSREDAERHLLPSFDGIDSPEVRIPGF